MDAFIEFCQSWTMGGIAARLFLATLAGVIIGMDREYKNKGAGIKTHALVCIGAALSMIVNEFISAPFLPPIRIWPVWEPRSSAASDFWV